MPPVSLIPGRSPFSFAKLANFPNGSLFSILFAFSTAIPLSKI